eukprot:11007846-Prorocentrum_lima.AAC.1
MRKRIGIEHVLPPGCVSRALDVKLAYQPLARIVGHCDEGLVDVVSLRKRLINQLPHRTKVGIPVSEGGWTLISDASKTLWRLTPAA